LKDRVAEFVAAKIFQGPLSSSLAAQIVARPGIGICFQRAHLQKKGNAAVLAGCDEFLDELNMRSAESAAVMPFLVKDTDQIDDCMYAGDHAAQRRLIMYVGADDLDAGEDE